MAGNRTKYIIEVITKGAKSSQRQVKGVSGSLKSLAKSAALAAGAYFGTRGLIAGFNALSTQGSKLINVSKAFENMSKKAGLTTNALIKFRNATNNTVSDVELMTKANNAMALGLVESDEQFADLLDTAQRLGAALGQDVTQSLDSLVTGMGRQSKLMLDNLGIMVDTQGAYDKYAEKIGIATTALDDNQKKIAFNEEAMFQAKKIVGEMGDEQLTTKMKMDEMIASVQNATAELGESLGPVILEVGKFFAFSAKQIGEFFESFTKTPLSRTIEDMKALGMETKDLELTANRLEQAETNRLIAASELTAESLGAIDNQTALNNAIDEEKILLQNKAELQAQIEEDNGIFRDFQIQRTMAQIEGDLIEAQARQGHFATQMELQANLNKLKKEEADLTTTINTSAAEGNESGKKALEIPKEYLKSEKKVMEAIKGTEEFKKISAVKDALRTAISIQMKALVWATPIFGPFIAGAIAAVAGAAALAIAAKVQGFAEGGDFVTNGRQLIMVGDNPSGQERVQITPLNGDPAPNAPSSGITLNISGNVLHESFVEENIVPSIREALRSGENMGI